MSKRRRDSRDNNTGRNMTSRTHDFDNNDSLATTGSFRATTARAAQSLVDGVALTPPQSTSRVRNTNINDNHDETTNQPVVILPWLGCGTYRLGKDAESATLRALECGYRCLDTAFIYGNETTETLVGRAVQQAIRQNMVRRADLFVITKHWRNYHGYDATTKCLNLSLKRLNVQYIDLYLMHWPGPSWRTMHRTKEQVTKDPWHYATTTPNDLVRLRAETWRAMEDAYRARKVRAIGVSNMTVQHLQTLKQSATLWPPAVNQVKLHPLHPQTELLEYCRQEGIVVQAYASLGGQDMGKAAWQRLLGSGDKKTKTIDLLHVEPVLQLATSLNVTPAQLLLRWGLEKGCALIPKSTEKERLLENADIFRFSLTTEQVDSIQQMLQALVRQNTAESPESIHRLTRLCWRNDPLRLLEFD